MENTSKRDSLSLPEDDVPSGAHTPMNRFTLDSVVEDEGGNLSIGQVGMTPSKSLTHMFILPIAVLGFPGSSLGKRCESHHSR